MKKDLMTLEDIKQKITDLKGLSVFLEVNRGRKKAVKFEAVIEKTYPSVFTVTACDTRFSHNKTFSYFDVLCGDVKILNLAE